MRMLKLLAAAAAMVMGAGQAQAVTWTAYEVQGVGTQRSVYGAQTTYTSGDVIARFVIDIDALPFSYSNGYTATGSTFRLDSSYLTTTAAVTAPGNFAFDLDNKYGQYGQPDLTTAFTFDAADPSIFPRKLLSNASTGTIAYRISGGTGSIGIDGTVTAFRIIGQVNGFQQATISVLPEPASWAMMILGAGVIGAVLRRRRPRQLSIA